ncbi:MAG: hypothetical protein PUE67_03975 [Oscillospiraceae bacterium]|nr:hypothetical protein [Oscillospiraceae bacterium]
MLYGHPHHPEKSDVIGLFPVFEQNKNTAYTLLKKINVYAFLMG